MSSASRASSRRAPPADGRVLRSDAAETPGGCMTPLFHPQPVNDPFGDPVVDVDLLFERRALLFDLGALTPLSARKILRLSHVFVSHTHMDHFAGFDRLLRLCLGRERELTLYGPTGFVAQVEHKLTAFTWNLVHNYPADF